MEKGLLPDFRVDDRGTIWLKERLCVPLDEGIREFILTEAHCTKYSIHPGSTKMYQDLKKLFWWRRMKRDIAAFVAQCDTCNQIKDEKQRPAGLLKPLDIPMWKWKKISMDFIVGLSRTPKGNDSIWVIVDRLTKSAHFIPVKATHNAPKLAELYIQNVLRLHGVPISIISDRGPQFTAEFWKSLHEALGTKLDYSTAYHPQTDGQTERVNQLLEDLLRACVLTYGSNWEDSLPFSEFSCNNSYQASIEVSPFQALYGRQCRTLLMWEEAENVAKDRENLQIAQSQQKSYADKRRRELTFEVGEFVHVKVSPLFHRRDKLAPRYIGPYKIKRKIGDIAYELELRSTCLECTQCFTSPSFANGQFRSRRRRGAPFGIYSIVPPPPSAIPIPLSDLHHLQGSSLQLQHLIQFPWRSARVSPIQSSSSSKNSNLPLRDIDK
ncbi:hypothetical protein U9M48_002152 [Paspalum notatum var. saurae]|uniref:Integrase catalytic domain-containing protein n=1 Tax=Paspalum notatum var. saurae TaxID=547442 RepID=A0AAQ3PJB9_PASNO